MSDPVSLTNDIYWVGVVDWNIRDFHGYITSRGSTYNAYLIKDQKIALIDTVKYPFSEELLRNIEAIIDPVKIDYIVVNHVEMDHSSSLIKIAKHAKNATRCKQILTDESKATRCKQRQTDACKNYQMSCRLRMRAPSSHRT